MSYSIQPIRHSGTVLIEFSGHVHFEARRRALADLEALLVDPELGRVLVDFSSCTSFGSMTMMEALPHARRMAGLSARNLRMAYVYPPRHPVVLELIAASRGFRFGQFTDLRAALTWLASDTEAMKTAA